MALVQDLKQITKTTSVGNRNDFCYLCARKIEAKTEREYTQKFQALKGAQEGKTVVKFGRAGQETCICMPCIHELAKENPLPTEE